jgi:hypothetical protein
MSFSPFDFDVVSGPPEPRNAPKEQPRPRPPSGREPQAGAPPAEPAPAK